MPSSRRRIGVTTGSSAAALLVLGLALGGCGSDSPAEPAPPQGSEPVAWVGAFCNGLGDVIAGVSEMTKAEQTPQGQKDGLLAFSDTVERAFTNTASKLQELGPPQINDGKQVHDTAVNFFTTAAGTVGVQRDKLAELDANDPEFVQKASQLAGPDLGAASNQMKELTTNQELAPAFAAAPECRQLGALAGG